MPASGDQSVLSTGALAPCIAVVAHTPASIKAWASDARVTSPRTATALPPADTIAAMPPVAAIANKEMVNAAFETTLDQGLLHERRLFQILTATEDKAEGMAAFIEKREGVWKGR